MDLKEKPERTCDSHGHEWSYVLDHDRDIARIDRYCWRCGTEEEIDFREPPKAALEAAWAIIAKAKEKK